MENEIEQKNQVKINLTYPCSDEFEFASLVDIIDFDKECKADIESGDGFLIDSPKSTNKKDMKNPNGIYSSKFGQKLGDANPFADRYSCECGSLKSRINHGIECPVCHTKVKYVDDNFKLFGWIVLKEQYHVIHPKFYDTLDAIFGSSQYNTERKKIKGTKLENMINFSPEVDQDGNQSECQFKPDGEPFYGIGMIEFYNRFDEILDYYHKKFPKKEEYFDEIKDYRYSCECGQSHYYMRDPFTKNSSHNIPIAGCKCINCDTEIKYVDKDIIFTHSIPVFTTHLRPADIRDGYMYYEPTNGIYNMINKHVHSINKDRRNYNKDIKVKNTELYKVQMQLMKLTEEIMNILNGKKGQLRMLVGGRYNFACRAVIRQSGSLRIDQVLLPYVMLVKCLAQRIINILMRTYNISPSEAYEIWSRALATKDERVCQIITAIIQSEPEGLPCIINRNPTILVLPSVISYYCINNIIKIIMREVVWSSTQ